MHDADCLLATLRSLDLKPSSGGFLGTPFGANQAVVVQVKLTEGLCLGWARQQDGSLALVGDLQRLSRCRTLQILISRITRGYAARQALQRVSTHLPGALIEISV